MCMFVCVLMPKHGDGEFTDVGSQGPELGQYELS